MAQVQPYRPQYKQLPLTRRFWRAIRQYWPLYVMLIPGMLFFLVYKYAPMYGIQIAFKNYSLKKGISGSPWLTETGQAPAVLVPALLQNAPVPADHQQHPGAEPVQAAGWHAAAAHFRLGHQRVLL